MKKIAIALVLAFFLVPILVPMSANAVTGSSAQVVGTQVEVASSLQAQINALWAQIKALQAQLNKSFGSDDLNDDDSDEDEDSDDDSDDGDDDLDDDSDDSDDDGDDSDDGSDQSYGTRPLIKTIKSEIGNFVTYPGAKLVIEGYNFLNGLSSGTTVYFGGTRTVVKEITDRQIVVVTPSDIMDSRYHVYVTNGNGVSEQAIVKVTKSNYPEINVISPRAGQVWEKGKTYTVKWQNKGRKLETKNIFLVGTVGAERGIRKQIASVTEGNKFEYTVPSSLSAQTYTLWVCGETCPFAAGGGIGGNARVIVRESETNTSNTQ